MTIVYEYGDGLYVNLTNRCDCACTFCIRKADSEPIFSHDLWLPKEPEREEVLGELVSFPLHDYAELVFCGYGEPSYRLDDIFWLCDQLRDTIPNLPPIRLNTNGHADLICGRSTAADFAGRLDCVSISLNASNVVDYCALTRPRFGPPSFDAMLRFAVEVSANVPEVVMTVVDCDTPESELEACRNLCDSLGLRLRIRSYSE